MRLTRVVIDKSVTLTTERFGYGLLRRLVWCRGYRRTVNHVPSDYYH
jgi:hypothetical protein